MAQQSPAATTAPPHNHPRDEPSCRYCWHPAGDSEGERLVAPCACSGSAKYIHYSCLVRWVAMGLQSRASPGTCELCQRPFFGAPSPAHSLLLTTALMHWELQRLYRAASGAPPATGNRTPAGHAPAAAAVPQPPVPGFAAAVAPQLPRPAAPQVPVPALAAAAAGAAPATGPGAAPAFPVGGRVVVLAGPRGGAARRPAASSAARMGRSILAAAGLTLGCTAAAGVPVAACAAVAAAVATAAAAAATGAALLTEGPAEPGGWEAEINPGRRAARLAGTQTLGGWPNAALVLFWRLALQPAQLAALATQLAAPAARLILSDAAWNATAFSTKLSPAERAPACRQAALFTLLQNALLLAGASTYGHAAQAALRVGSGWAGWVWRVLGSGLLSLLPLGWTGCAMADWLGGLLLETLPLFVCFPLEAPFVAWWASCWAALGALRPGWLRSVPRAARSCDGLCAAAAAAVRLPLAAFHWVVAWLEGRRSLPSPRVILLGAEVVTQ